MSSFVIPAKVMSCFLFTWSSLMGALSILLVFSKNQQIQRIEINEIANRHIVERFLRAKKDTYKS